MAMIETKHIRNIVMLGHGGSGKTSLTEAMLYLGKETDRLGNTNAGNTVSDYDPEEIARKFSIFTSASTLMWKDTKINILDAPGYLDFAGEVLQATRVADAAIITVDGKAGIEVGTELAWNYANDAKLPRAFFINKFDDNEARFGRVLDSLSDTFGKSVCPLTIPMVKDGTVVGCIDLVDQIAHKFDANGNHSTEDIPADSQEAVNKYRDILLEAVASTDENLMEKYFNGDELEHDEIVNAVHEGIIHGDIVPVLCGAATKFWGVYTLLDKIAESFPRHTAKKEENLADGGKLAIDANGEPAAFVFKTIADPFGKLTLFKVMNGTIKRDTVLKNSTTGENEKFAHIYIMKGKKQVEVEELACGDIGMVSKLANTNTNDTLSVSGDIAYAPVVYPESYLCRVILPASKGDEAKISQSITKMAEEDKTLRFENDAETKQLLIYGSGEMQLQVLASRLKSRFTLNVKYETPKIPYREKITKNVDVEGKHKKQNGGSGQYGHVKMRFGPSEEEGLEFIVSVVGGTVPKNFNPAVQKGIEESMLKGAYGYPMVHLKADLYDGSYHPVDSDEISFKTAASIAYKKALETAGPVLLEPVGDMKITVPDNLVGDVMGDLNKHRASVMGMEPAQRSGWTTIAAVAPKAELVDYPTTLRSMTQGRGSFTFVVTGYDVVPGNIAAKVMEENKAAE